MVGYMPLTVTLKFATGEQITSMPSIVMLTSIRIPPEARTTPVLSNSKGERRIAAAAYSPAALKYLEDRD